MPTAKKLGRDGARPSIIKRNQGTGAPARNAPHGDIFSVATAYLISLTPRFSEVYSQIHDRNPECFSGLPAHVKKLLKRLGGSAFVNNPLKKGVNERIQMIQSALNGYWHNDVGEPPTFSDC